MSLPPACGCEPPAPTELHEPAIIGSENGVLDTILSVRPAEIEVAGETFTSNVFDGRYIPPVLLASRGDRVRLRLVNAIDRADIEIPGKQPTNLHFHGMAISPNIDNVFIHIMPGRTWQYDWTVPQHHPRGLNWYHMHLHGLVEPQVLSGLSGLLVIDGVLEEHYPELASLRRRTLILKDIDLPGARAGAAKTKTINGQSGPLITVAPGEHQVWQVGNLGADAFFDVSIDAHSFWVIERDGNVLESPQLESSLYLPPGARAVAVVKGEEPGDYTIRSLEVDTGPAGDPNPEVRLATLRVRGPQAAEFVVADRLQRPPANAAAIVVPDDFERLSITNHRTIVFSEDSAGNVFYIDGKEFGPERLDTQIRLGAVEEWTLRNITAERHVFHIHQGEFAVTEIQGETQDLGGLRDVIDIPYQIGGVPGEVKIILAFTNPEIVGKFVYHCHILEHEDKGMMATIEVVP